MMGSPFGRVPEWTLERFLVAIEACGGGTPDLSSVLEVLGYVGIYGCKRYIGGASGAPRGRGRALGGWARPYLMASSMLPWLALQVSWIMFVPKITLLKVSFRLDPV